MCVCVCVCVCVCASYDSALTNSSIVPTYIHVYVCRSLHAIHMDCC